MPTVLIGPHLIRNQPGPFRDVLLASGFSIVDPEAGFVMTEEDYRKYLPDADALIAGGERLPGDVIRAAPRLRAIARTGVGYDSVDVATATERNIPVLITPGTNQESVAEQAFALLLALTRNVAASTAAIRQGTWDRRLVAPIRGRTMGLVGFGRIGHAVAVRALAFGMSVVAFDPLAEQDAFDRAGVRRVDLPELLASSDVVSLHAPLNDHTKGLVDRKFLSLMKPGSYLINTARGGLVVDEDLRDGLVSGHLAGAGLDVFNEEPPGPENVLIGLPNVALSPHVGGTDRQSMSDMAEMAARAIVDLHQGRWPEGCVVNEEIRPGWRW
ncbi:D-3-phosphoglycerate dehydrogenase [Aquisphaera giovannonii]|uniref:D-3-phosphoglycerate dehydrogenase n=1 Tax=Aquisphaera giovannonii TaxID=406548 RepID=A0A5B9W7M1_9BACT|nr:phosphoglycerate dehydrogenase [Aquisphaera giovannonii]QEH36676.1 D-3-phosphoglycerate dehydrogenase [Aquisphaera giovannonii]